MPHRNIAVLGILSLLASGITAQEPAHTNRLANESSPYLLQHAHNPVDWYPWSDEAFDKAKRENKLVFLSIGYAACHWCHVMEHESFEDPEIARIMNQRFVCVKVDREERPDLDQIYMTAVQLISRGGGGWPMSVFLLPDGRPFWGGTYFPARTGDRGKATGFLSVMDQVQQAWKDQPDVVKNQAQMLTNAIQASQDRQRNNNPDLKSAFVDAVAAGLSEQFDPVYGGFGYVDSEPNRPKFPEPSNLRFLLDRLRRDSVQPSARQKAKAMLLKSLDGMISGAMIDHLGGGFHRYSVDRRWQIPHFEKMLYDNGQLASIYAEAYAETNREEYRYVAEGICDFVIRELKAPGGGFHSSLDADSEGEEGKFYRWTKNELQAVKSGNNTSGFAEFANVYHLTGQPNFEEEFYVPNPGATLTAVAVSRKEPFKKLVARFDPFRNALFDLRKEKIRPSTDVKVLTAWNGLMIAGLSDVGRILKREDYQQAASDAAEFVLTKLSDSEGRLLRSYAADQATLNAYVDDYAFLANGLIALHRASTDDRWLQAAKRITDKQLKLFWDEEKGGFFFTSNDHPSLIVRSKDIVDAAIPAGQSVAAENLMYLSRLTDRPEYEQKLVETLHCIAATIDRAPTAAPRGAAVLAAYLDQE